MQKCPVVLYNTTVGMCACSNKSAHAAQTSLAKAAHYLHIARVPDLESQQVDPDH